MKITKELVHERVEVFYQNQFKTFYVNSKDNTNFVKPYAVFVSLGMTTSMESLENIKNALNNFNEFHAEIAKLSSKKSIGSQFLNTPSEIGEAKQFELLEIPKNSYNREQSLEYFPNSDIPESKWKPLFEKIDADNSWDINLLQVMSDTNDVRIYHRFINYIKDDAGVEYRIGIYVTEN